jgi:hypothetical protein
MSCVDNVRELQASLVPAEQAQWRCIWESGVDLEWDTYAYTILAGEACRRSRTRWLSGCAKTVGCSCSKHTCQY